MRKPTVCFTGPFEFKTRDEYRLQAEKLGFHINASVTKLVDFVIAGCPESSANPYIVGSKIKSARALNIPILSERQWIEALENVKCP